MGKYLVKTVKTGFTFNVIAGNGQVIGVSEVYTTKASCLNGIDSVKRNAPVAGLEDQTAEGFESVKCPKFEIYNDKAGEFRFRLKARNGEIILASEGYTRKDGCLGGVESVRKNSDSPIVEEE